LLRAAVKAGTPLGIQAKAVMDAGNLVSDDIMLGMLKERLQQADAENGFILDGYPRNLAQAEALEQLLEELKLPVDEAIQIDVEAERIIERIAKRAQEEGRSDDSAEIVANRMKVYEAQTAPVIAYYEKQQKLSQIYGVGEVDEVADRIVAVLASTEA